MESLLVLFLIPFLPLVVSQGIHLTGPEELASCQFAMFSWEGGRPPYVFQPLVDLPGPSYVEIQPVFTGLTSVWAQINIEPGSAIEFTVQDGDNNHSNKIVLHVFSGGYCPNPPPTTSVFDPSNGAPIITAGTVAAVEQFIWLPWTFSSTETGTGPILPQPSSSHRVTMTLSLSTSSTTSSSVSSTVPIEALNSQNSMHLSIGAIILIVSLGVLSMAFCIVLSFCRGRIARRWKKRKERRGFKKASEDGTESNADFIEADPFSTPFSSATILASSKGGVSNPKRQQWELRPSTSLSETLRPISTTLSTSVYPERSDDGMATEDDPYLTRSVGHDSLPTSIPSTDDSRSYHAFTSWELAQMLRSSKRSSSSSYTGHEFQISPSRAWEKEVERNRNGEFGPVSSRQ